METIITFADIHCHILPGVDDGAADEAESHRMLELSYNDGIRAICLTPHFNIDSRENLAQETQQKFSLLSAYAAEKFPGLKLVLGCEIFCGDGCVQRLASGFYRAISGKYPLVEFRCGDSVSHIEHSLSELVSAGYIPILAHVERYANLRSLNNVVELRDIGALIQVNSSAAAGRDGVIIYSFINHLIANGCVDFVADDCHHTDFRKPGLSEACRRVERRFGTDIARKLFYENAYKIIDYRSKE